MINGVWLFLLAGGIIWGLITGNGTVVMQSALGGAETAVTLSIKLVGVMCLWLGMLKIAEKAGVLRIFARIVRPLTRWLFPSVPTDHPAMGAVVMTITANMLGMGNAATPFGMKAMEELQLLNRGDKQRATPAMCTFLALCAAGFNLVPATIIALRSALGSAVPGATIGTTILVSLLATISVIVIDRICRKAFSSEDR